MKAWGLPRSVVDVRGSACARCGSPAGKRCVNEKGDELQRHHSERVDAAVNGRADANGLQVQEAPRVACR